MHLVDLYKEVPAPAQPARVDFIGGDTAEALWAAARPMLVSSTLSIGTLRSSVIRLSVVSGEL